MIPPKEFIRKISPFSFLSTRELDTLLEGLEVELYPKGSVICRKGERRRFVYVVYSGLVALLEDEIPLDYAGRGELFGSFTHEGEHYLMTARAVGETVCYLTPTAAFRKVLDANERFSSFFTTFIDRQFRSFRALALDRRLFEEASLLAGLDGMVSREPVVCGPDARVSEAVARMERERVSSILIVDEELRPMGLLTQADLRKIILHGNREDRVSSFMSSPVLTVPAEGTVFDGLAQLTETGHNHLVLERRGRVAGILTRRDIEMHVEPSASVFTLHRRIIKAVNVEQLAILFQKMHQGIAKLALLELNFYDICRLITSIHDRITRKAMDLTGGKSDGLDFAWIHMGSSGRKEQIVAADQDNSLIFQSDDAPDWAASFPETLEAIGIPRCPGGYMVSNPLWSQPLSTWKTLFASWFQNPVPDHVRYLTVFLDSRVVAGNADLFTELSQSVRDSVSAEAVHLMASDAVQIEPPLGMFGILTRFQEVDLKTYGIYPIVNGVRVLALDQGVVQVTNTRERLDAILQEGSIEAALHRDLLEAYGFLQELRLRQQAKSVLSKAKPDNIIKARDLPKVDLLILKESLKVVAAFQKMLMKRYGVWRASYGSG